MQNQSAVVFASGVSTVLPALFTFFAPDLRSSPLPTNSFFQNFVLGNGDLPEYIHPYLVRSHGSSLSLAYPSRTATAASIQQVFSPDLTISAGCRGAGGSHVVSAFDDLSVTLDLPPALRFFLVRGSPYITFSTTNSVPTTISAGSKDAVRSVTPEKAGNKHKIQLNSGRTFLVYSSSPVDLSQSPSDASVFHINEFGGILRVAYLPDPSYETVLDRFSRCYPVSGGADLSRPFSVEYRWGKQGTGELLLLAHPLHIRLLSRSEGGAKEVLSDFIYNSIDGQLVGVVGDSWVLKTDSIPVAWHSTGLPIAGGGRRQVITALRRDVKNLTWPIPTNSSYFYGKAIARAARLALIAEEVRHPDVIPAVTKFLEDTVTPWLDGSFQGNGFLYDPKWGGLVTRQGLHDRDADFGFGVYNDHHFHLGYFLYAIAVLSKLNQTWGRIYKPQAYAMAGDFMTLSRNNPPRCSYTRLRNFDLWKLHSWASGLTEFDNGRNQESTSEAVNAYYSAALMGLSYGDAGLFDLGRTLAALEIQAAVTWWHVRRREGMYEDVFSKEIRVVGILWANERDSSLWFGNTWETEKKLGIQVLPLLPVTEVLFRDAAYTRELVKWASPALHRPDAEDGWKGFVYALEGVYDKRRALAKARQLRQFDDGNSLSNMLWWLHSR